MLPIREVTYAKCYLYKMLPRQSVLYEMLLYKNVLYETLLIRIHSDRSSYSCGFNLSYPDAGLDGVFNRVYLS